MEKSNLTTASEKSILQYWRSISQHLNAADEEGESESFIKKQLDKLTFINRHSVLAHYLSGPKKIKNKLTPNNTIFPFNFNLSQMKALDHALSSPISIIEGPPGTGKTQTILNILANLVMQNKTVAVVSSNNAAVLNVKEKLEEKQYDFLVAALGNRNNKEQFFNNLPQWDVSTWRSEEGESKLRIELQKLNHRLHHLMEVERRKAMLQQQFSAYRLEQEHFESYYAQQEVEKISKLSFYRQTPEKIISFLVQNQYAALRGKNRGFLHRLILILRYGFTDFKKLQDQEIDLLLSFQRKFYELKVDKLGRQIKAFEDELETQKFQELLNIHQKISEKLFQHHLYQKYHGRQPIQEKVNTYKRNYETFIDQFPIILSTTHSLRSCVPDNFLFDYVIFDESSQIDLLTSALALSCCKNAIVVGDSKQLPQIVDLKIKEKLGNPVEEVGAAYDYFTQNLLSSMIALYGEDVPKVMLREHYRCRPGIIEFCNKKYYEGQLIAFTSEQEGDHPLVIYYTAEGNHMRELTRGQKGKFNQRELDVIEKEVLVNLEAAIRHHDTIGFTTPYRKQVEKASNQLYKEIEIDTVHKYQGRQKKTMILSTVLDNSRAGKKGLKFVSDPRLINVAVSRAEQRFILVTNQSFRKGNHEISDLIRYIEYSTLDETVVQSEIVSVFDLLYKEYSAKLRPFRDRIIKRSKFESENIMRTLLSKILAKPSYASLEFKEQLYLRNLLKDISKLDEIEQRFVNNRSTVDFVLYRKLDKSPVLVIEVDGFEFHENNPEQLKRDEKKDRILQKYEIPLLRLPTTGSVEEEKVTAKLDELLQDS